MKRCVCVYQRASRTTWVLRLIHPRCPRRWDREHRRYNHDAKATTWKVAL